MNKPVDYKSSGVDIDRYMASLSDVKSMLKSTATAGVVSGVGSFGGIFDPAVEGIERPYLVSSIDGVGTKLRVAQMAGRYDTVGKDIVNHCCGDIVVQGARPLFFMDYFGTGSLSPEIFKDVVRGLSSACSEAGCALLAGETAEMPGLYEGTDFDLVGAIVGMVDRNKVVTGESVKTGDVLIGLPSSGLHTNGYSLARKILFDVKGYSVDTRIDELGCTLADELLKVHRLYSPALLALMEKVKISALAHITGGGLQDNVVRVLPDNVKAVINKNAMPVLPIFDFMAREGSIAESEMYRVFNMGIGMVLAVDKDSADTVLEEMKKHWSECAVIGDIQDWAEGDDRVVLV